MMLGSDPEWFLQNSKGKVVSAIGKIGGSKSKPKDVSYETGYFGSYVQEDNVAVEYNTPPATSKSEWVHYQLLMKKYLTGQLDQLGLKPYIVGSHVFDDDELEHPRAWIFGCEPDFDAWKLQINPRPDSAEKNLRSAGGHIHIGYENPTQIESVEIARRLDVFVGLPLMVVDPDIRRMELYGKPGAIRFKPYGLEYRTPSNLWTIDNKMIDWVYEAASKAVYSNNVIPPKEVRDVIIAHDKEEAKTLMKSFGVVKCPL